MITPSSAGEGFAYFRWVCLLGIPFDCKKADCRYCNWFREEFAALQKRPNIGTFKPTLTG